MLDIILEYLGDGQFRTANKQSFAAVTESNLTPGARLRSKLTRPRSVPQNAYFHAMIQDAFHNQSAGPFFETWGHMKGWLLIQAGHCELYEFAPDAMTPGTAAFLRRKLDFVDFSTDNNKIYMRMAKSVRFNNGATHDEMNRIVDRVITIICERIIPGMDPDELRAEAKRKAA